MRAIISYLDKIAHLVPVFVFFVIILRIICRRKLKEKGYFSPLKREILLGIYMIIIFALFSQTVFSDLDTFMQDGWFNVNTTPFKFLIHMKTASNAYFLINVLGNIAFFIPIGLLTPLLFNGNSFLTSTVAGFLLSLSIELLQLPLLRATDIDDLILNTSGAVVGFIIYLIITKVCPKMKYMFRIKK